MRVARQAFACLSALLAAPAGAVALALRPEWRPGLGERLGAVPRSAGGGLWIHGASLGEVRAALPLVDLARARGHGVHASATTLAAREMLHRERPDLGGSLAPLDHPWCVSRALSRVQPRALVLIETELWPFWITEASERGIAVVIVSGRLSERSTPRYRRLRSWIGPSLARISAVGARSELDAERFAEIGIPAKRIEVTGDLKLEAPATFPRLAEDLAEALADTPLLVAGSTHEGEEIAALGALAEAERQGIRCALVLAPRRPQRADDVEKLAGTQGRRVLRRSRLAAERIGPGSVLVLDRVGDLPAVWGRARVAFVGGTLVPVGGHNLLEPARAGVPILHGPFVSNAASAAKLLFAAGAARPVDGAEALAREACELLADPARAAEMGESGARALLAHRGSAARSLALIERWIEPSSGRAG